MNTKQTKTPKLPRQDPADAMLEWLAKEIERPAIWDRRPFDKPINSN